MALVSGQGSTLNPNAPVFIPYVYRQVEDFSPAWWELVKNSAWFRDFWLSMNPQDEIGGSSPEMGLADLEDELEELMKLTEEDEEKKKPDYGVKSDLNVLVKELSLSNPGKWRNVEAPPAKAVKRGKKGSYRLSNKSSPRRIRQIHQPR